LQNAQNILYIIKRHGLVKGKGHNMGVTIRQIADICGVHRSTVDKVLHDRDGVSDEVRQKIKKVVQELGYKPNIAGKALSFQKRRLVIAVLLLKVDALEEIKAGVQEAYREYKDFGLEVECYETNNYDVEEQLSAINLVKNKNISGLIICPIGNETIRDAIDEVVDMGIPVITTNSDVNDSKRMCSIGQDSFRAGRVAGQLMGEILKGNGKVAAITYSYGLLSNNERLKGFETVINERYPDIEIIDKIETHEKRVVTFQKTLSLLEEIKDLDGIYITCGCVSEVGKAVRLMDKSRDIKIISFDLYPEIVDLVKEGVINFTIGQDLFAQGFKPVKVLFEYLFYGMAPETEHINTSIDIRFLENL
jgi:LacI family transcriptional regulator